MLVKLMCVHTLFLQWEWMWPRYTCMALYIKTILKVIQSCAKLRHICSATNLKPDRFFLSHDNQGILRLSGANGLDHVRKQGI